jgi:hypothetical protein
MLLQNCIGDTARRESDHHALDPWASGRCKDISLIGIGTQNRFCQRWKNKWCQVIHSLDYNRVVLWHHHVTQYLRLLWFHTVREIRRWIGRKSLLQGLAHFQALGNPSSSHTQWKAWGIHLIWKHETKGNQIITMWKTNRALYVHLLEILHYILLSGCHCWDVS